MNMFDVSFFATLGPVGQPQPNPTVRPTKWHYYQIMSPNMAPGAAHAASYAMAHDAAHVKNFGNLAIEYF